ADGVRAEGIGDADQERHRGAEVGHRPRQESLNMADTEKQTIEHEITRARDGIGDGIDELDRKLRSSLDFQTFASEHAPQLVAGGAVVGFLVGFGFPRTLRRLISLGVPLALAAYKVRKSRANGDGRYAEI